jgi:long-chain acyl-CoA synthetase
LGDALWEQIETDFGVRLCNVYGLSETTIAATLCGPDDENFRRGTVGRPLKGAEIALANDHGAPEKGIEQGEVLIRTNSLFSRYLNQAEATTATLHDGWLKTGDVGRMNVDGTLCIVGRIKNIIVKGGENINPYEITNRLLSHPQVQQAEVIGLDDKLWGEVIAAAIVCDDSELSDADIIAYCTSHLSGFKLPDYILRFDQLPYGASGKVQRQILKGQCTEKLKQLEPSDTKEANMADTVYRIAERIFKVPGGSVSIDSNPGNTLGWDSLGHLNFVMAVETQFGFEFSTREMMRLEDMAVVIRMIQQKLVVVSA